MCCVASTGSWTPTFRSPKPDFKRIASDFESQVLSQAQQKLEAFHKQYLRTSRLPTPHVVSGTHYKQILNYVESEGIDLIIMGTGTPMQKVMFGSVAEKVSRLSTVPVMLVKCA
jgi:nucleotide-binding universal stress UspA family protein